MSNSSLIIENKSKKTFRQGLVTALSGSLSGAVVSCIVQPFDVVRTKMQGDAAKNIIRGPFSTLKHIFKNGGIYGCWRGTTPSFVRLTIGAAFHFSALEIIRNITKETDDKTRKSKPLKDALIGGSSRMISTTILCPVTVIKTKMEYADNGYKSILHTASNIYKRNGVRGFFSGAFPTIITNTSFSALHYMFYRKLQNLYNEDKKNPFGLNLIYSTISAAAATILTQPVDVIRTRIQLDLVKKPKIGLATFVTLRQILLSQGAKGIMIGVSPRVFKRTLQTGMIWAIYEELVPFLTRTLNKN